MNSLKKPLRQSNIELLRIISMLMIVFHHGYFHGNIIPKPDFSVSYLTAYFFGNGGSVGAVVFFLITGYFLVDGETKSFNYKALLKFWAQCVFYSLLFTVLLDLDLFRSFSLELLAKGLLPILTIKWWFASTYFFVYLLHPFINILLNNLDKSAYRKLIIFLIVAWFIVPTLTNLAFQSNELIMAVSIYCIGGYIKRFGFNQRCRTRHYVMLFSLFYLVKFFSLLCLVKLFMIFVSVKPFYNRGINLVASTTFGVYLIHEYPKVRNTMWEYLNVGRYYNSVLFIPFTFSLFLLVFAGCAVIELIRKYTVGEIVETGIDRMADSIFKPLRATYRKITDFIFGKE